MKKILTIILTIAMLAAGSALASQVTGINISHADGFTVAQINVEGEFTFTHQTEIAKDGKPYRIIVDVLGATHAMGAKAFENLPASQISGIRTSQYSVDPQNTVRIVFDMLGETAYRIDAEQTALKVYVSDPDAAEFPVWSSQDLAGDQSLAVTPSDTQVESTSTAPTGNDPASIIAAINQALSEDRLSSLEPAPAEEAKEELTPVAEQPAESTATETSTSDMASESTPKTAAQILEEINKQTAIELESPKLDETPVDNTVSDTSVQTVTAEPAPVETTGNSEQQTEPMPDATDTMPAVTPENEQPSKSNQDSNNAGETQKKSLLPKTPNKTEPGKLAESGVETGTIAETSTDEQSTARFRRDPRSKRIKGTMVAEFPTRLVIKYKGNIYRDPFETLINETKTHNNPMEAKIPNVEGLRLVGILESFNEGNSALFEDKEGYGYILKAGDKVQKGYVLRVDVDRVYFQVFEYGWSRTVALDMEIF